MNTEVLCPKCNSNQITSNQKGFSGGKAVAGAILTGGIGLLAGLHGSKKVMITCLSCGYQYKAGDYQKEKTKIEENKRALKAASEGNQSGALIVIFLLSFITAFFSYKLFSNDWNFLGSIFAIAASLLLIFGCIGIYVNRVK